MKVNSKIRIFCFILIFIPSFTLLQSQNNSPYQKEIEKFERFVRQQMEIDQIPGLSVGFYKDDFIWTKGFGFSDLENKTPATAKSAYRLASNTKSMVAVAILQLVEKGKVDLDAEVQKYVPYFPRKKWAVTVRPLLGHLGGISHYKNYAAEGKIREHKDTRESLEIFADWELIAEPWTKYQYSSYAYNLLGAVIEGAAKQPFGDYLRENLWQPLGMNDTYMDDPHKLLPNRVRGYRLVEGEIKNSEFVNISSRFAAGGTRSTVIDLLKYAKGLSTEKVIKKESIDLMYTSMAVKDGYFTDYGMGWVVPPVNGRFHVYHTGGQPETRTLLVRFPKENFAFALAYNLEGANLHVYFHRLFQLIFKESWNTNLYAGNKIDEALFQGLARVFNYGLGFFDRYEKCNTMNNQKLSEAFLYLNRFLNRDSLKSNYDKFNGKIRAGRHPVAGQAFVIVGSYMADQLQKKYGIKSLEKYHKTGAVSFFDDYLKMYRAKKDYPREMKLSGDLEKLVSNWNHDWTKTNNEYIHNLYITPTSDLNRIERNLKKLFTGAAVYPDFTEELVSIARYFHKESDLKKAKKTANMARQLYPQSPLPLVMLANIYTCDGDAAKALGFYNKAKSLNPDDSAVSAARLNQYAVELIKAGMVDDARLLLESLIQLYPDEPVLYHSIGDIYLRIGTKYFKKALKIDPTFKPARDLLKKLD